MTLNKSTADEQKFQEALDKDVYGRALKLVKVKGIYSGQDPELISHHKELHESDLHIFLSGGNGLVIINLRYKDEAVFNASARKDGHGLQISNYVPRKDWEEVFKEIEKTL